MLCSKLCTNANSCPSAGLQANADTRQANADMKQENTVIRQENADIRQEIADMRQADADIRQADLCRTRTALNSRRRETDLPLEVSGGVAIAPREHPRGDGGQRRQHVPQAPASRKANDDIRQANADTRQADPDSRQKMLT